MDAVKFLKEKEQMWDTPLEQAQQQEPYEEE